MKRYYPFVIGCLMMGLCVNSCKKDEKQPEIQEVNTLIPDKSVRGYSVNTTTEKYDMPSNVIFVQEDINSQIISLSEDGELRLNNSKEAEALEIKEADILYSLPTEKFPDGYALKIVANRSVVSTRSSPSTEICYDTESAAIDEIFPNLQCTPTYEVVADKEAVIEYDIEEQIDKMPSLPFLDILPNNPTFKLKPLVDGWNKYTTNKRRLKVLSINKNTATAEYIVFDKDNDFQSQNDQVILELKLNYDLSNTRFHSDYHSENGIPYATTFGVTGYHSWGIEASLKFSPEKDWTEDAQKEWKNKVKRDMLSKKFLILSLPLTATSPTSILVNPKFDVFFEITCDIDGEFKLSAGITDVRYTFSYLWSAVIPVDDERNSFNISNKGTPYVKAEISANIEVGCALGMGVTFDIPAFKIANKKKTYFGIYADYGIDATLEAKVEFPLPPEQSGACFDVGGKFVVEPSIYAEYELNLTKSISVSDKTENLLELLSNSTGKWFDYLRIEEPIAEWHFCTNEPPPVKTGDYQDATNISAIITGEIATDFPIELYDKGFYYSTDSNPIGKNGTKVSLGKGMTSFFHTLSDLTPTTTYYYVAYGSYGIGTRYGEVKSFSTTDCDNAAYGFDSNFWTKSETGLVSNELTFGDSIVMERDVMISPPHAYEWTTNIFFELNNSQSVEVRYYYDNRFAAPGSNSETRSLYINNQSIALISGTVYGANVFIRSWFREKIALNKNTGLLRYFHNNNLLLEYNISTVIDNVNTYHLKIYPFDCQAGHYFKEFSVK